MATHQSALWNMRCSALILAAALLVDLSATAVAPAQGRQAAAILRADSFIRVARSQTSDPDRK
jgi:hypothetical protein